MNGYFKNKRIKIKILERAKGFEPSTSTLARLRSTPELRPLSVEIKSFLEYNYWVKYVVTPLFHQ